MDTENVQAQEEEVVLEENTSTEQAEEFNDDTVTLTKAEFKKLQRQAIAYKANKEKPVEVEEKTEHINNSVSLEDVEFRILKAQGVDDELLQGMRELAKIRGKSILEVQNDPIIRAMKETKEAETKARLAKLPASRGSAPVRKEKSTTSVGLSEEEHKALWREAINK